MKSSVISMFKTLLSCVKSSLSNEQGIINILPWILGITSLINMGHRQAASRTLEEDIVSPAQLQGSVVQSLANRGLNIGPQSPVVAEALRRQSLQKRQQKAQGVLAQPDPFQTLFGIFGQN